MKNRYSFNDYYYHLQDARITSLDMTGVKGRTDFTPETQELLEQAYNAGARDSVSLIKLHGGFKFNY